MSKIMGIVLLSVAFLLCVTSSVKGQGLTEQDVLDLIDKEIPRIVDRVIDEINYDEEFKNITGITIGAAIAIFVVICIVPSIIIMLLFLLCCYCCQCGVFQKPKQDTRVVYNAAPLAPVATSSKPMGPAVPPKPQSQTPYSPPPQQQTGSMWPWGKEESQAYNRNQGGQGQGVQNQAYNGQW